MTSITHAHALFDTPAWRDWLASLPELEAGLTNDRLIQGGRNQLYRVEHDGRELVLKCFANRGLWKKLSYRFVSSKARRSFEHSERLIAAGVESPQPVAWREDWEGGWLERCYYVCERAAFEHEARALKDPATGDRALKAGLLGDLYARMHRGGILHLDCTPGNVLFVRSSEGGWRLQVIDNNRMAFGAVSYSKALGSLAQADLPDDLLPAFLEAYAKSREFDLDVLKKRYARRAERHRLKWAIKNGTRPLRRKLGL